MDRFVAWLAGYFLADGYDELFRKCGKESQGKFYFDTKDHELAVVVATFTSGSYRSRVRVVQTGTKCLIYTVGVGGEFASKVRDFQESYKNFVSWFKHTTEELQDSFMQGLFDGDGSICKYQGTDRSRILYIAAEPEVEEIIEYWCQLHNLKPNKSCDRRGKGVTQYTFGSRRDKVEIIRRFNHGFLMRKKIKLDDEINLIPWFVVDDEWVTFDRKLIEERTGLTQNNISYSYSKLKPSKGHVVTKVKYKEIPHEVCIYY